MGLYIGYVYVLVNPGYKGLVKIGRTQGDPKQRAKQISTTGVPDLWAVYAAIYVPNCALVERAVHHDLKKLRHRRDREFFKIAPEEAVKAVQRRADENISQHPGWPDPGSVQDQADREALKQKNEADELAEHARLDAIEQGQERRRAAEDRRWRAEQERIAAAKRREEEEARALAARRARVDQGTKETLESGPIGWGTVIAATFFGLITFRNTSLMWSAITFIMVFGAFLRYQTKKDAVTLRQQWNLPPFGVIANVAPQPLAKESSPSPPAISADRIAAGCIPSAEAERSQAQLLPTLPLKPQIQSAPVSRAEQTSDVPVVNGCAIAVSGLAIISVVFFMLAIIVGSFSNKPTPPLTDRPARSDHQEDAPIQRLVEPTKKESLLIPAPPHIDPTPTLGATETPRPARRNQKAQAPPKQQRQTPVNRRKRGRPKAAIPRNSSHQQQVSQQVLPPAQYQPPINEAAQQWMRGYRPNTEIKVWTHGVHGWKQENP